MVITYALIGLVVVLLICAMVAWHVEFDDPEEAGYRSALDLLRSGVSPHVIAQKFVDQPQAFRRGAMVAVDAWIDLGPK